MGGNVAFSVFSEQEAFRGWDTEQLDEPAPDQQREYNGENHPVKNLGTEVPFACVQKKEGKDDDLAKEEKMDETPVGEEIC